MINRNLKRRVITEANNIKKYATTDQINLLDFNNLDPDSVHLCVYGQMTGHCYSPPAFYLVTKCTKIPYSESSSFHDPCDAWEPNRLGTYSPIEFYIMQEGAKNKNLIDFIKGEKETLKESDL